MPAPARSPHRRQYKNPPVAEAIARLHWNTGLPWKMTTPGLLHEALKAEYPAEPQVRNVMEAQLQASPGAAGSMEFRTGPQQLVFSDGGGGRLLIVGPTDISAHGLAPYEGWESLEGRLFDALAVVKDILIPPGEVVSSVGLRYINRVDLPGDEIDFAEWLTVSFALPPTFPQQMVGFLDRIEVLYPDAPIKLSFTWASAEPLSPATSSFILDFDLVSVAGAASNEGEARELLASLKLKETEAFEGLLKDSLRERFGALD